MRTGIAVLILAALLVLPATTGGCGGTTNINSGGDGSETVSEMEEVEQEMEDVTGMDGITEKDTSTRVDFSPGHYRTATFSLG